MPVYVDPDYGSKSVSIKDASVPVVPALSKALLTVAGTTIDPATGVRQAGPATAIQLFAGNTVAATSAIVDRGGYRGPGAIVFANVGTGSPSLTLDIKGSVDNVNFYNAGYSLVATPNTVVVTQITITTSATTTYLLAVDQAWRYLELVVAAVTTQTWSAFYYQ